MPNGYFGDCKAELGEYEMECHDRNPEFPAGQTPSVPYHAQHGGQTASSSTKVCIKACSAVSDACKVECENDPSCLQECSNDYDGCVNDCGQNTLKDRNGIASVANSTNSEIFFIA